MCTIPSQCTVPGCPAGLAGGLGSSKRLPCPGLPEPRSHGIRWVSQPARDPRPHLLSHKRLETMGARGGPCVGQASGRVARSGEEPSPEPNLATPLGTGQVLWCLQARFLPLSAGCRAVSGSNGPRLKLTEGTSPRVCSHHVQAQRAHATSCASFLPCNNCTPAERLQ